MTTEKSIIEPFIRASKICKNDRRRLYCLHKNWRCMVGLRFIQGVKRCEIENDNTKLIVLQTTRVVD